LYYEGMKVIKYDDQLVAQIEYFDFLINNLNVESLIHGYCSLSRDWIHENITSPFHRLYFILSGSGTLKNTDQTIPLNPGHIIEVIYELQLKKNKKS